MSNCVLPIILILINTFWIVQCIRILGVFPMPSRSHYILGSSLMRGLAEKGHDVTIIAAFEEKEPPKNGKYRQVLLTDLNFMNDRKDDWNMFDMVGINPVLFTFFSNMLGNGMTEAIFNHTNVQNLLHSNQNFDVVIVAQFLNDAHKVFAHYYNAPLVAFVTFGSNNWINPLVANPAPPSYIPEVMIDFSPSNFIHRLTNFFLYTFNELNRHLLFFPAQNKIMKKYFPDAPDLSVLNYNISLVLLNSHVSTNEAVPRVPNMIDIGGFHVQPPKKLPQDLQQFLDDAKEGVVYFSMGSNLKSAQLPAERREMILKTFAKLKQKVLWKFEDDVLPGQPPNVKLGKWLPQADILAHPNVKLFITHGGLLSLIESVYHGKPIVAIPVLGDQKINAQEAEWNGFGIAIQYKELTEEKLTKAVHEVLTNPKYTENMKRRSNIMHDRRTSAMDDAEYWIEYVIRHNGAHHLRVAGVDLPWYQYLCLDVAIFILASLFAVLYLIFYSITKVCCSSKKGRVKQS